MENLKEIAKSFRPPSIPGSYFLSFEGIEGAGKTTQILHTQKYLEGLGFRVLILREPGGTPFGEKLRKAILESKVDLHPVAEAHLFASSRAQLLSEVTLQELSTPGTIVIYDRFIDSSLVYQGMARKLGMANILKLHLDFPLHLVPHLTLYLKVSLEKSLQRQEIRNMPKDYFEGRNEEFHRDLIAGYDKVLDIFPERIVAIDGNLDENTVFAQIKQTIDTLLESRDHRPQRPKDFL